MIQKEDEKGVYSLDLCEAIHFRPLSFQGNQFSFRSRSSCSVLMYQKLPNYEVSTQLSQKHNNCYEINIFMGQAPKNSEDIVKEMIFKFPL